MSTHVVRKLQIFSNSFKQSFDAVAVNWLVLAIAIIADATEHIIRQLDVWCVNKVQVDSFSDSLVDRDASVLLSGSRIGCFLFKKLELRSVGETICDQMGKPECQQITNPKTKVDTNYEEHIVSVSLVLNQVI